MEYQDAVPHQFVNNAPVHCNLRDHVRQPRVDVHHTLLKRQPQRQLREVAYGQEQHSQSCEAAGAQLQARDVMATQEHNGVAWDEGADGLAVGVQGKLLFDKLSLDLREGGAGMQLGSKCLRKYPPSPYMLHTVGMY